MGRERKELKKSVTAVLKGREMMKSSIVASAVGVTIKTGVRKTVIVIGIGRGRRIEIEAGRGTGHASVSVGETVMQIVIGDGTGIKIWTENAGMTRRNNQSYSTLLLFLIRQHPQCTIVTL